MAFVSVQAEVIIAKKYGNTTGKRENENRPKKILSSKRRNVWIPPAFSKRVHSWKVSVVIWLYFLYKKEALFSVQKMQSYDHKKKSLQMHDKTCFLNDFESLAATCKSSITLPYNIGCIWKIFFVIVRLLSLSRMKRPSFCKKNRAHTIWIQRSYDHGKLYFNQ